MNATLSIVRHDAGEKLNALGVIVRFICGAEDTQHAWSLMENIIPQNSGPPPHHHP